MIDAYSLVNFRAGWVSPSGVWEGFVWVRNAFDTEYFQYMSVEPGNSGAIFALLGDPRTYGVTLRLRFRTKEAHMGIQFVPQYGFPILLDTASRRIAPRESSWPSGWWIPPAMIVGLVEWIGIISLIVA